MVIVGAGSNGASLALGDGLQRAGELHRVVAQHELNVQLAADTEHRVDVVGLHAHTHHENASVLGGHPHGALDHARHADCLEDDERLLAVDLPPRLDGGRFARVHHHADVCVVLRRRTHHGRPTDVDRLDARRRREGIQVDHHEVDRPFRVGHTCHHRCHAVGRGEIGHQHLHALTPGCEFGEAIGPALRPRLPTLMAMGALDDWTPVKQCEALLGRIKADRDVIETHVYPDAHHSFDALGLPVRYLDGVGNRSKPGGCCGAHYGANEAAWKAFVADTKAFLARHLAP